jgi:hypothetical protein
VSHSCIDERLKAIRELQDSTDREIREVTISFRVIVDATQSVPRPHRASASCLKARSAS